MQVNLNRIIIFAGDTLLCATFFRDFLGMSPMGEWSSEWAELDGGGCHLAFHQAYGPSGRITKPTGSAKNPHKIVFMVDDVEAIRQELIEKGVEMGEVLHIPKQGNLILCDGADPEGHRFQICSG